MFTVDASFRCEAEISLEVGTVIHYASDTELMNIYVLTVFLGSFLLFGVQPMLGRTLLPSFGSSAAVWTVCLAAYQTLLLAGYLYAHVIAKRSYKTQRTVHRVLLALAVVWAAAFCYFRPALKQHIGNSGYPALEVLFCVCLFAGLPYVLLSAGSTLIQSWLAARAAVFRKDAETHRIENANDVSSSDRCPLPSDSRNVYKLYAISNLGSFLGLLAYPFILEPFVSLNAQWWGFTACLLGYTVLLAAVAKETGTGSRQEQSAVNKGSCQIQEPPPQNVTSHGALPLLLARPFFWFILPALSCFALVATTNRLTLETTPIPLFWVLLLSAFLLSYVVGFSDRAERGLLILLFFALVSCVGAGLSLRLDAGTAFEWILLAGTALLFFGGTVLHGWLHAIRPEASRLTGFYLAIAAGGAAGGVVGSLLPPVLFKTAFEFPLAIVLVSSACAFFAQQSYLAKNGQRVATGLSVLAIICVALCRRTHTDGYELVTRARNFYGTLRVEKKVFRSEYGSEQLVHYFKHGNTTHGVQFRDTGLSKIPTAYFGPEAGGFPIMSHPKRSAGQPMRVGIVGLGVGVLAAYGRDGDTYRFYEINPQVIGIAKTPALFSFISDCAAKVEIVEGDARKRLEKERLDGAEKYDVLIIDVFSGDSIAPHLISAEAFDLFKERLAPDGLFGIHISNWHIDLFPVCKAVAKAWGMNVVGVVARADESRAEIISFWSFLSQAPLPPLPEKCLEVDFNRVADMPMTTDEKGSLLRYIRFVTPPPVKEQKPK